MMEASKVLRLSIWKSFKPKRPILRQDIENNKFEFLDSEDSDNLQEEIYTWQTAELLFDGIENETNRQKFKEKIKNLEVSLPPSERGISILNELIQSAESIIDDEKLQWIASQSELNDNESGEERVNGLLAITLHLKWLSECFADCPGISVSIR